MKKKADDNNSSSKSAKPGKKSRAPKQKPKKADYWDNVASDAAAGFRTPGDNNKILNVDQLPRDDERADTEPSSE
jgi:hypothetical protein